MIARHCKNLISARLSRFPAVAIIGPRQSGKTTLAKEFSARYFDLEQETDRLRLDLMWNELVSGNELIVLDEAQAWPDLFSRLRGAIDARRKENGRFLLLGSVSPTLMRHVGDSLAGRLAIVELQPFTLMELPVGYQDKLWRFGGFPDGGVLEEENGVFPVWQQSYLRQLSHMDLPAWGLASKPAQTERLFRLLAAAHGGQYNASHLGQGLGVSYHTVQSYVDFLEGAFLVRRLKPFFANNIPKRLVKSPKIYLRDSGLLHSLLGTGGNPDIFALPWVGASWEGWVIEQIINTRTAAGESFDAWYFRTSDGMECDLLIESDGKREVIEIKLSSSPGAEDFSKLRKIAELAGASRQVLISRIRDEDVAESGDRWSMNLESYLTKFSPRLEFQSLNRSPEKPGLSFVHQMLREAAGGLKEQGILTDDTLMRRAAWLVEDLEKLSIPDFRVLPMRWLEPPGMELRFPMVEYVFGKNDHDINRADNPMHVEKNVNAMSGTGLDREDLLYFSKVSEIGHTLIPHLWLGDKRLREDLLRSTQHVDTLNEVWWLSRWQGLDGKSVERERTIRQDDENLAKPRPWTVDWSFTVLGGQIRINLSVKNRRSTHGTQVFDRLGNLFDGREHLVFPESGDDEINVLAITAWYGGWLSPSAQAGMVETFLDCLNRPVIDAVALSVRSGNDANGGDSLYFPKNRDLRKKDLVLRAIFKPMDLEDQARVGECLFPIPLPEVLEKIKGD